MLCKHERGGQLLRMYTCAKGIIGLPALLMLVRACHPLGAGVMRQVTCSTPSLEPYHPNDHSLNHMFVLCSLRSPSTGQ